MLFASKQNIKWSREKNRKTFSALVVVRRPVRTQQCNKVKYKTFLSQLTFRCTIDLVVCMVGTPIQYLYHVLTSFCAYLCWLLFVVYMRTKNYLRRSKSVMLHFDITSRNRHLIKEIDFKTMLCADFWAWSLDDGCCGAYAGTKCFWFCVFVCLFRLSNWFYLFRNEKRF